MKGGSGTAAWLSLLSAAAGSVLFILSRRLSGEIHPLPLVALLALFSLPLLYAGAVFSVRKLNLFVPVNLMKGPIGLSLLLFPGFFYCFSQAMRYSHVLKLALVYMSVLLLFKAWSLRWAASGFRRCAATLILFTVPAALLSRGFQVWPLLWPEGMMALAAVCLSIHHILIRLWCSRKGLPNVTAHFWSLAWSTVWVLGALWITGKGLPLPPFSALNPVQLALGAALFVLILFIIPEIRWKEGGESGSPLIEAFFFPCFIIVLGFLEFQYWPNTLDLAAFLGLIAGSLLLSVSRRSEE